MTVFLHPKTVLQWPDYAVVLFVLAGCISLAFYFQRTKTPGRSTGLSEFLLASRDLSVVPVALSIAATSLSAFSLTGFTGEMYIYGIQFGIGYLGIFVGTIFAAYGIIPIYRKAKYVSVFELLEERFDGCVRRVFSFVYIFQKLIFLCMVLYLPALSLTTLSAFDHRITTIVLGIVCTLYSSLGGFRTVIWTDVIQSILMMITLLMIVIQGSIHVGGFFDIWRKSVDNGFLTTVHWTEGENVRYSIWATIIGGLLGPLDLFVINQAFLQRVLGAKTNSAAKFSVILGGAVSFIFGVLIVLASAILYIAYHECDPIQLPEYTGVRRIDQLFVYAIGDLFMDYPLLKGVAISGIISASLSTFSSFVNAFAAVTMEDFVKPIFPGLKRNENAAVVVCVAISFGFGTLATLGSFLMPLLGNAIRAFSIMSGVSQGPLLGAAILALFWKNSTKFACLCSLLIGIVFNAWMIGGNLIYVGKRQYITLELSTEGCGIDYTYKSNRTSTYNGSSNEFAISNPSIFMPLYEISFMWYIPIGIFISLSVGITYSLLLNVYQRGKENSTPLSPFKTNLQKELRQRCLKDDYVGKDVVELL